ncbi:MAG: agmatine deiminase family protein [Prolixibacteraceae bacterium]
MADKLKKEKYSAFLTSFEKVLIENDIHYEFLSNTKDIWAVDFMPVQISTDKFVQFEYEPDYLQFKTKRNSISDVDSICKSINLLPVKSNLIIDGGNVIRTNDKVIMCDKVFKENSNLSEKELIKQLRDTFEVDNLFFVPWDKRDFTGHADGMVRFIDSDTVLINDYSKEEPKYQRTFRMALHNAGLDWFEIPYNPYENKSQYNAEGVYLNYLQMKQAVIVPTFKRKEDEKAIKILEQVFKGQTIATIDSNEIAIEGGILNCITWNIQTTKNGL